MRLGLVRGGGPENAVQLARWVHCPLARISGDSRVFKLYTLYNFAFFINLFSYSSFLLFTYFFSNNLITIYICYG